METDVMISQDRLKGRLRDLRRYCARRELERKTKTSALKRTLSDVVRKNQEDFDIRQRLAALQAQTLMWSMWKESLDQILDMMEEGTLTILRPPETRPEFSVETEDES